jgi:hypothetical protein
VSNKDLRAIESVKNTVGRLCDLTIPSIGRLSDRGVTSRVLLKLLPVGEKSFNEWCTRCVPFRPGFFSIDELAGPDNCALFLPEIDPLTTLREYNFRKPMQASSEQLKARLLPVIMGALEHFK